MWCWSSDGGLDHFRRAFEEYPHGVNEYASKVVRWGGNKLEIPVRSERVWAWVDCVFSSPSSGEKNGLDAAGERLLIKISIV